MKRQVKVKSIKVSNGENKDVRAMELFGQSADTQGYGEEI